VVRSARVLAGGCAAAIVAAIAASPAYATFGAPLGLGAPEPIESFANTDADVAVDNDGDALFVWNGTDGSGDTIIQARRLSAAGVLGPVRNISPPGERGGEQASVAVDNDGDAVIAWSGFDAGPLFEVRTLSAGGVLGPVQTLGFPANNTLIETPAVAVDRDGDAVIVFKGDGGTTSRIQARTLSAGGVLGPTLNLSPPGQGGTEGRVAMDPSGDAVFAWVRSDGTNGRIQTAALSAAGALSPVQTVSPVGQFALVPAVAVNPTGDAMIAWVSPVPGMFGPRVRARTRSAAGALGPITNIATGFVNGEAQPSVALDNAGDAIFAWQDATGDNTLILARERTAAGALSPIQRLSAAGQDGRDQDLDIAGNGRAVVTWTQVVGQAGDRLGTIEARERTAAGALRATQILSDPGTEGFGPHVALGAGNAVVAWPGDDGTNNLVQGAVGP